MFTGNHSFSGNEGWLHISILSLLLINIGGYVGSVPYDNGNNKLRHLWVEAGDKSHSRMVWRSVLQIIMIIASLRREGFNFSHCVS